jgi:hypothetical protein
VVVACSGGGGSKSQSLPKAPAPAGPAGALTSVALQIKVPGAAQTSGSKRPAYIPSNLQSIGVTVAPVGASPGPAQYTNVSTCPTVSGVVTCTITVQAPEEQVTFAINAYSGTNGTGSALATGSVTQTISATTSPIAVTLGGIVASLSVTVAPSALPLGQVAPVTITAKDASGAIIVGQYDNPINVTLSNNFAMFVAPSPAPSASPIASPSPGAGLSLASSSAASGYDIAWARGFMGNGTTALSASVDGQTANVTLTPTSGFALFGATPGFSSPAPSALFNTGPYGAEGPDGNLYLTYYNSSAGSLIVQALNPQTLTGSATSVVPNANGELDFIPYFTSDGAMWLNVATRIANPSLNGLPTAAQTAVPLPTAAPIVPYYVVCCGSDQQVQVGSTMYMVDGAPYVYAIPVAGPYTAGSVTAYPLPSPPAGSAPQAPAASAIALGSDGNLYISDLQGAVQVFNP